jgi:hypothetical protein
MTNIMFFFVLLRSLHSLVHIYTVEMLLVTTFLTLNHILHLLLVSILIVRAIVVIAKTVNL